MSNTKPTSQSSLHHHGRSKKVLLPSRDLRDPLSIPLECVPLERVFSSSRRRFLAQFSGAIAGALILPTLLENRAFAEDEEKAFISAGIDPTELWLDGKQIVVAYKQGEELGERCRVLDDVKAELPVALKWKLAEEWVKVFPTIHFETSSRNWQSYEGWTTIEQFTEHYEQFLPPPKSDEDTSPFKEFAADYSGRAWTFPGEIEEHLRNPKSPHKFSVYEIRNLTEQEMINLHSAHHEKLIEPGLKTTSDPKLAKATQPKTKTETTGKSSSASSSSTKKSSSYRRQPSLFRNRRFR